MEKTKSYERQQILELIRAIEKIRFGSVEIVIHESKIVQMEVREKVRFEKVGNMKS